MEQRPYNHKLHGLGSLFIRNYSRGSHIVDTSDTK